MKTIILLFALSFPALLLSQTLNQLIDYEVVREDHDGAHIEYSSYQSHFKPQLKINTDDMDTLYITYDLVVTTFMYLRIVGPNFNFKQSDIIWIGPSIGYILLNSEYEYTIGISWYHMGVTKWVFEENFTFSGTDTLKFNSEAAINELIFAPVDNNGTPFNQLPGIFFSNYYVMIPQGNGYYCWQDIHIDGYTTLFSDLSENIYIQSTSLYFDVIDSNYACNIEFPALAGINEDVTLTNEPDEYVHTNAQMFFTAEEVTETKLGFMSGICYRNYLGKYVKSGAGVLVNLDGYSKFWNGDLFFINQTNDDFKIQASMMAKSELSSSVYSVVCRTPHLESINDSVTGYWSMFPPHNIYKAGDEDTLCYGLSPSTFWYDWYNNGPENTFYIYGGCAGMLWEQMYPLPDMSYYSLTDENGNVVLEGPNYGHIEYYNAQPGYYSLETINYSSPIDKEYSTSTMDATFYFGGEDANSPKLNPIQLRNSQNKPTHKINAGEPITLYFSAKDPHDIWDTLGNPLLVYQPIVDDSTKGFIKDHNSNTWQQIEIEKYYQDTITGSYFVSDLSDFTNIGSTALDLKIRICDFSGNFAEYTFSPAILIDSVQTNVEQYTKQSIKPDLMLVPNPAQKSFQIHSDTYEKFDYISIMNINGELVKENNIPSSSFDISDIKPGMYFVKLVCDNQEFVKKLVVIE